MICTPTLHDPSPVNAETFLRWTKLHNRELLDLPAMQGGERITRALRFVRQNATGGQGEYVHSYLLDQRLFRTGRLELISVGLDSYFYTILTNDMGFFHTEQYAARSLRLDLENTRSLDDGEQPVGCKEGQMVWDICDAKFTIYEQIPPDDHLGIEACPSHPRSEGGKWLVGASLTGDANEVKRVQRELVEYVRGRAGEGKVFSSVYKHGGEEAQPENHPEIAADKVGGGEWLVVVLVVDEEGKVGDGGVEGLVGEWGKGRKGLKVGVWKGELDMV